MLSFIISPCCQMMICIYYVLQVRAIHVRWWWTCHVHVKRQRSLFLVVQKSPLDLRDVVSRVSKYQRT